MPASMFQNASNIRISGKPTFQQINGSYHYHDNTTNTTNNNTTNITGNDFSQTIHNSNAYTIACTENHHESTRRKRAATDFGSMDPPAHRVQTAPALPYSQQHFPNTDTQVLRHPTLPAHDTQYASSTYMPSPFQGFPNRNTTDHSSSFQPCHIMTMTPEVSAAMTSFFSDLGQKMIREDEDCERGGEDSGVYEQVSSQSPLELDQPPQWNYGRTWPTEPSLGTTQSHAAQPFASCPESRKLPNPLPQSSINTPYSAEQPPLQSTPHRNPIPPRVRRTLQAAFAFNSNLGGPGPSSTPTHTSKTSTSFSVDGATTTSSSLPFEYASLSDDHQEVPLVMHTGSVVEARHTENTTTYYSAVVSDDVPASRHWEENGYEDGYDMYDDDVQMSTT